MRKNVFTIILIFVIIIMIVVFNCRNLQKEQLELEKFNKEFEEYNTENLNGLDITTVINKAINNNEKYEIEKDENGDYIKNDENSIKIYITMIINQKTYTMEKIYSSGIEAFIQHFGGVSFKCSDIKYHSKTGKISEMTFEATEY